MLLHLVLSLCLAHFTVGDLSPLPLKDNRNDEITKEQNRDGKLFPFSALNPMLAKLKFAKQSPFSSMFEPDQFQGRILGLSRQPIGIDPTQLLISTITHSLSSLVDSFKSIATSLESLRRFNIDIDLDESSIMQIIAQLMAIAEAIQQG
ncbi:UNVERIFIED_CONTAM: hypothetical protein RMT77_006315 [Armadillidium vulgare]